MDYFLRNCSIVNQSPNNTLLDNGWDRIDFINTKNSKEIRLILDCFQEEILRIVGMI